MEKIILHTDKIELLYEDKNIDIKTLNRIKKIAMLHEETEPMLNYIYDKNNKTSVLYFKEINVDDELFLEKIINKKTTLSEIEEIMNNQWFFIDSLLGINNYIKNIIPDTFKEIKDLLDEDILINNININEKAHKKYEEKRLAKYNINIMDAIKAMKDGKKITSIKWFDHIYAYYEKDNDKFYYYDTANDETRYLDISEFLDVNGTDSLEELINTKYKIYEGIN